MPFFRGIEISIHASLQAKQVTEYPHPDGSSVHLLRTTTLPSVNDIQAGTSRATQLNLSPTIGDLSPICLKKVNPRISVYIPSLPGEQFWLRYLISQSPPPSRFLFFRMTMNGRHISSWGINTSTHSTGIVARALYQPEGTLGGACDSKEAGFPGIETRYFHFMSGLDGKSVAEDGGSIEVQIFRCKGRKRIAVELDAYRNQERYGIASPSGGLVDNPEDATYYNYYLIDAKDSPYATFCFHYRSMKYLKQLSLIPQARYEKSSNQRRSLDLWRERSTVKPKQESASLSAGKFTFGPTTTEPLIPNEYIDSVRLNGLVHAKSDSQVGYVKEGAPVLSPLRPDNAATEILFEVAKAEISSESQHRPLPEIPNIQPRPASSSSLRSNCPSLTPSLRNYVESDDFENEDIRLSTAQPMLISSESMQALELVDAGSEGHLSFSDYASSPTSTEASGSPKLPSPEGYIPTTGSVLERHFTQFDSPVARSTSAEPTTGVLELTESEWLRHTPSPLQGKDGQEDQPSNSSPESHRSDALGVFGEDTAVQRHQDSHNQVPIGNWI